MNLEGPRPVSSSLKQDFTSAKLKIQWANMKIDHLKDVIDRFLEGDFYSFSIERDPHTCRYRVIVTANGLVPVDVVLLLGDAIHNLRAALDHAATVIVGTGNFVYFPFHERVESLIAADGKILCPKTRALDQAVDDLGRFIVSEIKPYRAGNPFLWKLNKLDNIDKHKFLIPAISLTTVTAYDLYNAENNISFESVTATVGAGGTINLIETGWDLEVRGKIEPSFDLVFTEETFFDGQPVVETLGHISNAVAETLYRMEEFISQAKGNST